MRRRQNAAVQSVLWLIIAVCVGASAIGVPAGAAVAGPPPEPPGRSPAKQDTGHPTGASTGHPAGGGHPGRSTPGRRAGHHHLRPRTVVRCQNDDTDQIDEFGDTEDGEPRHIVTPGATVPAGGCPAYNDALGLARILAGDRPARTGRTARR